jgi:hypothetical protein
MIMEEKLGNNTFMIVLEEVNSLNTYVIAILIKICDTFISKKSRCFGIYIAGQVCCFW